MRLHLSGALLAVAALCGCDQMNSNRTTDPLPTNAAPTVSTPAVSTPAVSTPAVSTPAPDNTDVNERDASGATKTPIDQDENQADITRTAEIRRKVVARENLSTNAHNAKIVTSAGKVTLRGPVDSQAERDALDQIAREVAGDANVDNQLEVAVPTP